jgi:hypothetical protein
LYLDPEALTDYHRYAALLDESHQELLQSLNIFDK